MPVSRTTEGSERGACHGAKRSDMRLSPQCFSCERAACGGAKRRGASRARGVPEATGPPSPLGLGLGRGEGGEGQGHRGERF
ncbi:MAG: hypothetical protein GXY48_10715 [Methanomicrobiales archaeon]|nr:hypothetical protein [Methanomicrobiales archaeon]